MRDVSHPYRLVTWTCGGDVTLTHDNQLIDFFVIRSAVLVSVVRSAVLA